MITASTTWELSFMKEEKLCFMLSTHEKCAFFQSFFFSSSLLFFALEMCSHIIAFAASCTFCCALFYVVNEKACNELRCIFLCYVKDAASADSFENYLVVIMKTFFSWDLWSFWWEWWFWGWLWRVWFKNFVVEK